MRKLILSLIVGTLALGLFAGCSGPSGSTRREMDEVRRERDKEISEMEAGKKAPE